MVKVYAPNKQYTGLSASVHFVNGVGKTDDLNLIKWFKDKGYTVDDVEASDANNGGNEPPKNDDSDGENNTPDIEGNSDPSEEFGIDDLTKDQIKEKLDALGVEYTTSENKDVLFEKLIDAMEE